MKRLAGALAVLFAVGIGSLAVAAPVKTEHLQVELAPQTSAATPGGTVYVALHQKIRSGWHTYWRNPGDSGQATEIKWTLPPGWKAGEIVWPTPHRFATGPLMNYVFSDEVYLPVPIEVPADAKPGQSVNLSAEAHFLVCADICVPEDAKVSLTLPVTAGAAPPDPQFGRAIADTLAAAPKPEGLNAAFQLAGDGLKLAVTGAAVKGADIAHAYFYPYDGAAIDHARVQKAQRGPDGLTLTMVPGFAFQTPTLPAKIAGVLSLGGPAYVVEANAGPLPAGAAGTSPPVATTDTDAKGGHAAAGPGAAAPGGMGLLAALGFAFVGGLILNLMPCVFPVLSLKAAALARHAGAAGAGR